MRTVRIVPIVMIVKIVNIVINVRVVKIVPVVKNADQLSLLGICKSANNLIVKARDNELSPDDVLDGTFNKTLQIGDKAGHSLDIKIDAVSTNALGMAGSSFDSNTLVGGRIAVTSSAAGDLLLDYSGGIAEGDIKINGQDVGAIDDADDMGYRRIRRQICRLYKINQVSVACHS